MAERRISTQDVQNQLDRVVKAASASPDAYIVVTDGPEQAAVISLELYRDLMEERRARKAAEAVARWDALAADIGDRNADLSQEEIEDLANQFSEEFARELVAEGKIRFASE